MSVVLHLICFPVVDLRHPPNPSATQAGVLIAVPPAIYSPLNEPTLTTKARIKLSQGPANRITLALVVQAVALILILGAARPRIHAILRLEILGEAVHVDRFNIASDRILHLDPVSRVLERNPLDAVLILTNDEWRGGGNGSRRGVWVYARTCWRAMVNTCGISSVEGWFG
jgi:hypothetical protein